MVSRQVIGVRRSALIAVATLAAALAWAWPAAAACHLAAFVESTASVGEGGGSVTVTVELQGRQPSCAGTVTYETRDDSASAGSDYEAQSGELTFLTGDDRVEDIVVPITSDDGAEEDESFMVVLTGATGVSVGSPDTVTVTITDDDEAQPEPTEEPTTEEPTEPASETTTPADEPTVETTTGQPAPITTELPDDEDDGTSTGLIALIVVAVVAVLGAGGWLVMRGRQA